METLYGNGAGVQTAFEFEAEESVPEEARLVYPYRYYDAGSVRRSGSNSPGFDKADDPSRKDSDVVSLRVWRLRLLKKQIQLLRYDER